MRVVTRFAPSPTGLLHLGNARTALLNFFFAQSHNGMFILRLDDTDQARSKEEYKQAIQKDLQWLGINWHSVFSQSEHLHNYQDALERLKVQGLVYPCYESQDELDLARRAALRIGKPPIYNRAALSLSAQARQELEKENKKPHWRFKLSQQSCPVQDLFHGTVSIDTASLSDPILIREDGRFLYSLPSVVDDLESDISHVIRGDDHLSNSAIQVELTKALGGPAPIFAHHPLMLNMDGAVLSKRTGDLSLQELKQQGFEPEALRALLMSEKKPADFDFSRDAQNNIRFDRARLERINAQYLHQMGWEQARPLLPDNVDEEFWLAMRDNLTFFHEIQGWWNIIYGNPKLSEQAQEKAFLADALALLPKTDWDEQTWSLWTKALAQKTGRKGADLYLPLRLALTGLKKGPELKKLILLLGYQQVAARLRV